MLQMAYLGNVKKFLVLGSIVVIAICHPCLAGLRSELGTVCSGGIGDRGYGIGDRDRGGGRGYGGYMLP